MISRVDEKIDKVMIDAGLVYIDYGLETERLLGMCRGDNELSVEIEIREVEANGQKGKTKGARRKITENASLKVNLIDLSIENLKIALPGSTLTVGKLENGWKISLEDYIDNIVLIGKTMDDQYKKITLFNVLVDEALSLALTEKDEAVVEMTLSAHYDPTDLDSKLWSIEDKEVLV